MLTSWITRKFGKPAPLPPVAPDAPFYAIGDIHGRIDLLHRLLAQLDPEIPVFCLGDYVDRGPDSADVLRYLAQSSGITCLKGNHESMMLDFLFGAGRAGAGWLRNGGLRTLESFGITGLMENAAPEEAEQAAGALRSAMGDDLTRWLLGLPVLWQTGNVALVHAGADPRAPMGRQQENVLLWGHPDFARKPRRDGIWVVHGHRIVQTPVADSGRIAVDTGAYATGRLTAALVSRDGVRFIST